MTSILAWASAHRKGIVPAIGAAGIGLEFLYPTVHWAQFATAVGVAVTTYLIPNTPEGPK